MLGNGAIKPFWSNFCSNRQHFN